MSSHVDPEWYDKLNERRAKAIKKMKANDMRRILLAIGNTVSDADAEDDLGKLSALKEVWEYLDSNGIGYIPEVGKL